MRLTIPDSPDSERTPLVLLLLDLPHQQQERIAQLEDELAVRKGLKPRPTLRPSTLETPPSRPARSMASAPALPNAPTTPTSPSTVRSPSP